MFQQRNRSIDQITASNYHFIIYWGYKRGNIRFCVYSFKNLLIKAFCLFYVVISSSQLQEYKLDCMVNSYQNMLSHVQVPAGPSWTCSHRVLLLQGLDEFNGSLGLFEESLMGLSRILFPKQQMVTRQIIFDF